MDDDLTEDDFETVNKVLNEIGIGRYQILNFAVICSVVVLTNLSTNSYIFTARETPYRCFVSQCESNPVAFEEPWLRNALPYDDGASAPRKCERYPKANETASDVTDITCDKNLFNDNATVSCSKWVFGESNTIVRGFNIPCQDWKRSLVGTLNSAGVFVSLFYSGVTSDKFGRRNTLVCMMVVSGLVGLIQSFSTNFWMFSVLEFLNMAVGSGVYGMAYILAVETLPPDKRLYGCATIEITSSLSTALVGIVAWFSPSWKYILRYSNTPMLIAPLILLLIPESLRWLYANNRKNECVKLLKKSARMNGLTLSEELLTELDAFGGSFTVRSDYSEISLFSMLKSSRLTKRLFFLCLCWFGCLIAYNGLIINSVNLSVIKNNIYLDFVAGQLIGLPSVLFYFFILNHMNRRSGIILAFICGGISCITSSYLANFGKTLSFVAYLLTMLFVNILNALLYVFSTEVFPTISRNSAISICIISGSIGGMLTPQILLLAHVYKSLPMIMYGLVLIISAFFVLALPETKDKKIPDTIEQAEEL